ncbi:hypothetical protein FPV67DRAFT_1540693 [Lyophyllum atratum]|nr:hypothetical protein FPV67DRAFT_1540693 [Lyophyllum atratum]
MAQVATSVPALNLPPHALNQLESFLTIKLRRAVAAAEARNSNAENLESPWYEVWSLFLEKLLLRHNRFGACPQATIVADIGWRSAWRTPDFIVFRYLDQLLRNQIRIHDRIPRLIVEIKRHPTRLSVAYINSLFRSFMTLHQIRDQAKVAFARYRNIHGVYILQCLGRWWRSGYLARAGVSPLHDNHGPPPADIQWEQIVDVTTPASDQNIATNLTVMTVFAP